MAHATFNTIFPIQHGHFSIFIKSQNLLGTKCDTDATSFTPIFFNMNRQIFSVFSHCKTSFTLSLIITQVICFARTNSFYLVIFIILQFFIHFVYLANSIIVYSLARSLAWRVKKIWKVYFKERKIWIRVKSVSKNKVFLFKKSLRVAVAFHINKRMPGMVQIIKGSPQKTITKL